MSELNTTELKLYLCLFLPIVFLEKHREIVQESPATKSSSTQGTPGIANNRVMSHQVKKFLIGAEIKSIIGGKVNGEVELGEYLKDIVKIDDAIERMADLKSTFEKLSEGQDPILATAIRKLTITDEVQSLIAHAVK